MKSKISIHLPKDETFIFRSLSEIPLINGEMVKNPPATAGDARDVGLTPGGGNGNPLESSCLENPMDRGGWRATVHEVDKGQTGLSD